MEIHDHIKPTGSVGIPLQAEAPAAIQLCHGGEELVVGVRHCGVKLPVVVVVLRHHSPLVQLHCLLVRFLSNNNDNTSRYHNHVGHNHVGLP